MRVAGLIVAVAPVLSHAQSAGADQTVSESAKSAPVAVHNVVLVHGFYADGSSWGKVIPLLQAQGLHVTSVQNPLTSLQDDVDAVKRALAQQDGPALLVGHSWGGMVISEAGMDAKVSGLVFVSARAPDAGEDWAALARKFPAKPASAGLKWNGDWGALSQESFVKYFVGDLPETEALSYYAVQQPIGRAATNSTTTVAAWRVKPSWFIVPKQDQTLNPDVQRFVARRMGAATIEVDCGHVPMLSQPQAVADLIVKAAQGKR
ncbi:alpha/beta fold hydrolase [Mitsuaria sp. 7]|uniref:alpha/beta fold hydrolase n=1 Tax=Mitsuaria sp. 7 TaxID=1658665 RepID=UPI000AC5A541|nr:alpha/beta hydrolase [Mitsuaria sp. 7]